MKETRIPPALAANLVANSGNTIYGVGVIQLKQYGKMNSLHGVLKSSWTLAIAGLPHHECSCATQIHEKQREQIILTELEVPGCIYSMSITLHHIQ